MTAGKILFFGRIADAAGAPEWPMPDFSGSVDEATFIALITTKRPDLAEALCDRSIRICVNQDLHPASSHLAITKEDEVAFLSPMSGG
ncbi:MAG: hypothetical protein MRY64_16525 [Hyphomonadaceae bacterium]|nr:hypothetical protein [Hyphomonadaceae bacterium]